VQQSTVKVADGRGTLFVGCDAFTIFGNFANFIFAATCGMVVIQQE
jgi:hypothetical protein